MFCGFKDPSIKELVAQIAHDPAFNQMAEQLQKTFQDAPTEESLPQFDTQQYYSTMQQVMENPQFMTMVERLGSALMQDPSMSGMLENFANPTNKDQLEERMAIIREDPSLKPILEETEWWSSCYDEVLESQRCHAEVGRSNGSCSFWRCNHLN